MNLYNWYRLLRYRRSQYFNMSSNNLDEKPLLKYISVSFEGWGMGYITPEVLKKAKKNEDGAVEYLSRLLFDLCILHIFDYKFTAKELNAEFNEDEKEMKEIIVAHLFEVQCPFVVEQIKGEQIGIGIDFTSSRHLLVVCGWVMAVSNYFGHTNQLFSKTYEAIYKPQPLNFADLMSKVQHFGGIDLKEESDKLTRVAVLSKLLRSRKYTVQCLMQKRAKLYKNLRAQLKQIDTSLNLQELLGGHNEQTQTLQQQLRGRVAFEKENMGLRKYWWIWLEQKIIQSQYVQLSGNYQQFQKLQVPPESIKDKVQIDMQFIKKYLEELQFVENKVEQIASKIQELSIKPDKPYKQIQRDILQEIKTSNSKSQSLKNTTPSFIGMQLQRYLQLSKPAATQQKQTRKQIDKILQKSYKKLSQSISKSIADIDDIVII